MEKTYKSSQVQLWCQIPLAKVRSLSLKEYKKFLMFEENIRILLKHKKFLISLTSTIVVSNTPSESYRTFARGI